MRNAGEKQTTAKMYIGRCVVYVFSLRKWFFFRFIFYFSSDGTLLLVFVFTYRDVVLARHMRLLSHLTVIVVTSALSRSLLLSVDVNIVVSLPFVVLLSLRDAAGLSCVSFAFGFISLSLYVCVHCACMFVYVCVRAYMYFSYVSSHRIHAENICKM